MIRSFFAWLYWRAFLTPFCPICRADVEDAIFRCERAEHAKMAGLWGKCWLNRCGYVCKERGIGQCVCIRGHMFRHFTPVSKDNNGGWSWT